MRFVLTAALLVVAGCSLAESQSDVHPAVVRSVDQLEADGDCVGLQAAFDRHDEADTLEYIDDALNAADCYD